MSKIDDNLPTEVLALLAKECGFSLAVSEGAAEWKLSAKRKAGQTDFVVEYTGTRQSVCAFLTGYGAMHLVTTQLLNEIDSAHRELVLAMRSRLGR